MTDTACSGVNQHFLACVNLCAIDQPFPGRDSTEWKCRSLTHGEISRLVGQQVCVDEDELGKCTLQATCPTHHTEDFVADLEACDTGSDVFNSARHIKPEYCEDWLLCMLCRARTDLCVQRIHAACSDAHQDLALRGCWTTELNFSKIPAGGFNRPDSLLHRIVPCIGSPFQ